MPTTGGGTSACAQWAADVCSGQQTQVWLALVLSAAVAVILVDLFALRWWLTSLAKFREWRTARVAAARAAAMPQPRDHTAALVGAAAEDAFGSLYSGDLGERRWNVRTGLAKCVDDFSESDWLCMLIARANRATVPLMAENDRAARLVNNVEDAFDKADYAKAAEYAQRITTHLAQSDFKKAAVMFAAQIVLRADDAAAPTKVVADLARRSLALSDDYGCVPAQALSALMLARCALRDDNVPQTREMLARVVALREQCAPLVQIALADVQAELNIRVGNFDRARHYLNERVGLERRQAEGARAYRHVQAHYLADLARVELAEAQRTSGKNARRSGRKARHYLEESVETFQAERDACSLALVYTRMAMAAVMQHQLGRARTLAQQGRKYAELMRSVDLISSADDLVRRIENERMQRRLVSFDWVRGGL